MRPNIAAGGRKAMRMALPFPWRPGSAAHRPVVAVTATCFTFCSTPVALRALPHALGFWKTWPTVDDSIGLSIRYLPISRQAWTVSAWTTSNGADSFVRSAAHREVMRMFRGQLDGTSRTWLTDEFDLPAAWQRAYDELPGPPVHAT